MPLLKCKPMCVEELQFFRNILAENVDDLSDAWPPEHVVASCLSAVQPKLPIGAGLCRHGNMFWPRPLFFVPAANCTDVPLPVQPMPASPFSLPASPHSTTQRAPTTHAVHQDSKVELGQSSNKSNSPFESLHDSVDRTTVLATHLTYDDVHVSLIASAARRNQTAHCMDDLHAAEHCKLITLGNDASEQHEQHEPCISECSPPDLHILSLIHI